MIVYYNQQTLAITGLSYKLNPAQSDPYIITDDPIAEDLFLGKSKTLLYQVLIRDADQHIGFVKKKGHITNGSLINEQFYLIPFKNTSAEVIIVQDTDKKVVTVNLSENAKAWWEQEKGKHKTIVFYACELYDLYKPRWITTCTPDELLNQIEVEYQGSDSFCFFTKMIFESYTHDRSQLS